MSRERRAADPWLTREREAEIDDAEPRWSALTDTGSMTPSPEALTWQRRADAWAQQSEIEPYSGGGGQAVEPANRWSDVAATGRPTFPADGTGWRTQTSEWRATGARWRQTTEWRSSTGSHVWRSTTEAWQPGDDDEQQQPTISGTAWPTPEDNTRDVSSSWSATKPVEQTWSSSGTPSWQQPATSWDSGRRTPGENTTDVAGWDRSGGSGWQSGPRDDGRHYVREDDRAAWRQADTEWSTRRGRRRAPEPDEQPSGGSGWSSGDETDNWAGHADTGNISYAPTSAPSFGSRSVRRGPQPPPPDDAAAAQRGQTPIQFGVRPGSRRAAPDEGPSGPIDTGAASAGQPERQRGQSRRGRGPQRYNANPTNWREDTASWDAEPDTSNWTRDPDTGQWSRAEDDPRVLAWRAEAARRDQMRQGDADEQPGRGEQPTPDGAVGWGGRRGQWDDEPSGPIGGVPGGPLPSSAVPDGPGSRPRSAMPAPRSAMPAPRSAMPSQRSAMPSQRSAMPSQRSATPSSGGAGWAAGGAPWNGADQPDPYSSGRIHADQPDAYTSGRIRADQGPGRFGAEQYDSGGRRRAPEADSGSWDARQGRPTGPEDDYAADGRRQGPMPPRALPAGRSGWPQQAGPRELPAGPSGSTTPEQSWPDRGQEQAGYGARQYGYETPRRTGAPETDGTFDLRRATGGNAGWSDPRSADPVGNSWSDPRSTGPADAAWTDARRGDVPGGRPDPRRADGPDAGGWGDARRAGQPDASRGDSGRDDGASWNGFGRGDGATWGDPGRGDGASWSDPGRGAGATGNGSGRGDGASWNDPGRAAFAGWGDSGRGEGPGWDGSRRAGGPDEASRGHSRRAGGSDTGDWRDRRRAGGADPGDWSDARRAGGPDDAAWPGSRRADGSDTGSWNDSRRGGAPDTGSWGDPRRADGPDTGGWHDAGRGGADTGSWGGTRRAGRPDDASGRGSRRGGAPDGDGWSDTRRVSGARAVPVEPSYGMRELPAAPERRDDDTSWRSNGYGEPTRDRAPSGEPRDPRKPAYGAQRELPSGPTPWPGTDDYQDEPGRYADPRRRDDRDDPPYGGTGGRGQNDRRPSAWNGSEPSSWDGSGGYRRDVSPGTPGYRTGPDTGGGGYRPAGPGGDWRADLNGGAGHDGGAAVTTGPAGGTSLTAAPVSGTAGYRAAATPPAASVPGPAGDWRAELNGAAPTSSVPGAGSAPVADWRAQMNGSTAAPTSSAAGYRASAAAGTDWRADMGAAPTVGATAPVSGATGYRPPGTPAPAADDWRREMARESAPADGDPQRFSTSDFPPFRPSGSAAVEGAANLALSATSVIAVPPASPAEAPLTADTPWPPRRQPGTAAAEEDTSWPPRRQAGTAAVEEDTSWPPRRQPGTAAVEEDTSWPPRRQAGTAAVEEDTSWPPRRQVSGALFENTGSYERRPVSSGVLSSRQNDLLNPDDEDEPETSSSPLAAVGYTVVWYGVPVVLFIAGMLLLNSGQRAHALQTLANAAPEFGISLTLSIIVAFGLRFATSSWKSASVGLAAAVVGGGLATVLSSAITGNSLS